MSGKAILALFVLVAIWLVGGAMLLQGPPEALPAVPAPMPNLAATPASPAAVPLSKPGPDSKVQETFQRIRENLDAKLDTLRNDAAADYSAPATQTLLHDALAQADQDQPTASLALNLIFRQRDAGNFRPELMALERGGPAGLKPDAVTLLLTLPGTEGIAYARKYHRDADATLRQTAIHELAQRRDKADLPLTVPMLAQALQDDAPLIRKIAGNALRDIAGKDFKYDYSRPTDANTQAIASIKSWAKASGYSVN